MNAEELRARLAEADRLDPADGGPGGVEYVEAMRALVPPAEALGEPDLLFTVRLSFAWALRFTPLADRGPAAYFGEAVPILRRCLLMWHAEPHLFAANDVRALWNQLFLNVDAYIWLYPEPADRIHRFLDELERYCPPTRVWTRYAIDHYRMLVDARRGDVDAVERRWHRLRAQGDPQDHFHLDGKAGHEAVMWQRLGRNDRALAVLAPLAAGLMPTRDGHEMVDDLIMPYLRAGRFDEALAAHERTWSRPGMKLGDIAAHLEFCARTGNEERGLDVLQRNRRFLEPEVTSVEAMWTAAAAALLCHRALAKDLDREWIWPCGCDTGDCDCDPAWSYAELGATLRWEAVTLAEKIDGLNGTGFQGERIRALLAAEPVADLPVAPSGDSWPLRTRTTAERLETLASPPRGRRQARFTALVDLVRAGTVGWDAVGPTLDAALTRPTAHTAQIDALLRALEPLCRPGTGDLHLVRWFRVELEARRGDADAAVDAWTAFGDLPPDAEYATPANVLRRTLWWLDLGLDGHAIEARPARDDLLLLPYLRTGRADEARAVHERTRHTTADAPEVAAHLAYCADTGELAHGAQLLRRHLDLFRNDRNDTDCTVDRVRLYDAVSRLCARIAAAGADRPWTWPGDDCCEPEEGWTYTRLGDECRFDRDLFVARWRELGVTNPGTRTST